MVQWLTSCADLAAPVSLRGLGATVGGNFLRALGGVIVMDARVMLSTVCVRPSVCLHSNTAALKVLVTGSWYGSHLFICAKQNHSLDPA